MADYEKGTPRIDEKFQIKILEAGPYLVYGAPPIRVEVIEPDEHGTPWRYKVLDKDYTLPQEPTALCRCGHSRNAPYCDGAHTKVDWDARLTAPHISLLSQAETTEGPSLVLTDNEQYCAYARICDAKGRTWNQVMASDEPKQRELAIYTANECPAGRLKVWDRATGEAIETHREPSIALIEDPGAHCSGPIWVKGGIPITDSKGYTYQVRNRVTLCRCGNSYNKPFCDATHVSSYYYDGIKK